MRPAWKLRSYYFNKLAPNLHKAFLSGEAKVKLYFGLGMSMNKAFLDELRTEAVVDVDQFTRMIRFFQIDKYRLYMEFPDLLRPLSIFPEPSMMPNNSNLWREHKKANTTPKSATTLMKLFQEDVAPNLHLADIDIQTKAKLYFALSLPVNHEQIKLFQEIASVMVDESRRIVYFKDTMLEMQLDNAKKVKQKRNVFSVEEENRMYAFVYKRIPVPKSASIPKNRDALFSLKFWNRFNQTNSINRDGQTYLKHFRYIMLPVLHLASFPKEMKLALLFSLDQPPNEDFFTELRKDGIVTLNSKGCIVGYSERNVKNETLIDVNNNPEYTMSDVEAIDVVPGKRARYNSAPPQLSLPPTQEGVLAETIEDQNELTNQLNMFDIREVVDEIIRKVSNTHASSLLPQ
ncbi:hypothetical protein L5515_005792 [Caenorhabditis briggsae]|uniref:SPK domain-containing protein n=1 Tax=Caenorhabditis briggsae TaxID=6238 RepID=A0AAE9EXS6_CAEBR|nr:hypothetical protein L5515_005792 [Caenorhabditis briggsae]